MDRKSFTHILCGVDGSAEACRAAAVAAHLAKTFNARLTFVTVAQTAADTPELDSYKRAEAMDPSTSVPLVEADADVCLAIALEIASTEGVQNANRVVRTGGVADAILSLGTELSADVLVVGHHGRSRVGRAFKPPVSSMIADQGTMKVLLVP